MRPWNEPFAARTLSIAASPEDASRERCLELLIGVDADGTAGADLTLDPGQLIDVEGPLTLNDQDLMVDAALDGAGLAYVFEAQAEELIAKKKLVRVLADWCPAYPGFFLYYPSRRQLPAALRAFVDFIRAAK